MASATPRKRKWTAERLLTDPKSPLASADLRSLLSRPASWKALDADERRQVLSLFPSSRHILDADTDNARLNFDTLLNDDTFRKDCANYTENIAQARHDPEWLASAWAAHERRKMGDFDEFLVEDFESTWGVKLPEHTKPQRRRKRKEETSHAARADGTGNHAGSTRHAGQPGKLGQEDLSNGIDVTPPLKVDATVELSEPRRGKRSLVPKKVTSGRVSLCGVESDDELA